MNLLLVLADESISFDYKTALRKVKTMDRPESCDAQKLANILDSTSKAKESDFQAPFAWGILHCMKDYAKEHLPEQKRIPADNAVMVQFAKILFHDIATVEQKGTGGDIEKVDDNATSLSLPGANLKHRVIGSAILQGSQCPSSP